MFMANISSADHVYDEAGPSYDLDILSEVHDHDHYQGAVCEHHEEHEMHDDVQLIYVVDSHADYMSNSNMIPYDQYVKDNAMPVVQSNVSSITNDAYMMIYNDMCEPHAQELHQWGSLKGKGVCEQPGCYLTDVLPLSNTLKRHFEGIQKALTKEVKEMKEIFEELEAEVNQHVVDRKHDEIERKNLLIANDNLIADCLFKDVFHVATNSELNVSSFTEMHDAHTSLKARCLELEVELSDLHDKIQKINHDELLKRFSNLEMKASIQGKDNAIKKLRMRISQLNEADRTRDFRTLDFQITQLTEKINVLQEQNELFRAENGKIKQHYKELEVHLVYFKHLKESVETLCEIIEEDKVKRPLDSSLASACRYTKHSQEFIEYVIGVNSCTDASGSQPRSNTMKNRILPAKSVNMKKVEELPRTIKSSLKTMNRVDSSISSKRTVIGNSVISRVYYVEGLGHNLFSVRQFCDSDLEVAFRKHYCFVRDTDGVE
ncbi:hypothetical protein Tco_1290150, partial [Tanacetum coccineum]